MDDRALMAHAGRIEELVAAVESFQDSAARSTTIELLQALLHLYGEGLARLLDIVAQADLRIVDLLAKDELVAHLLLLHNLHPRSLEDRVAGALAEVRPYLESHGGNVELVSLDQGIARLRLHGSCRGRRSSAMTLTQTIEEAVQKAAPDLVCIEVEAMDGVRPEPAIIPLHSLARMTPSGPSTP